MPGEINQVLPVSAVFEGRDLLDASRVPATIEGGLQPDVDDPANGVVAQQVAREAQDVGVVVAPGDLGGQFIMTDGGSFSVKLQVNNTGGTSLGFDNDSSLSWTLVVYPEATSTVPAVSSIGLGVLVVAMISGGMLVLKRRQIVAT